MGIEPVPFGEGSDAREFRDGFVVGSRPGPAVRRSPADYQKWAFAADPGFEPLGDAETGSILRIDRRPANGAAPAVEVESSVGAASRRKEMSANGLRIGIHVIVEHREREPFDMA